MQNFDHLIGKRFKSLVVREILTTNFTQAGTAVLCQCDCGSSRNVGVYDLISHRITSCGCRIHLRTILTDRVFGKLTVISISNYKTECSRQKHWLCACECGNSKIVRGTSLLSGNTTSCGCICKGSQTHGTVYGIYDKDDNLKYVGQTISFTLEKRLKNHINYPSGNMKIWLKSLDYIPTIKPLIPNVKIENLNMMERQLIRLITSEYHPLLNIKAISR